MDPRQMDLKRFYKLAAVIFTRAYIGIYKENDSGMIHEPQTDEDMINNAQKVIDGLLTKTNDPDIMSVSGADIVSGDHKAVDAIVSVLYAEGNRLWLKKLSRIEESRQQVQRDEQSCVSEPMQRKKKNGKRARRKASEDALNSDNQDGAKEDMRSRSEMDDDRRMDQANNDDRVEYGHSEDYKAIAIAQVGGVRRKRPSSAPSHSRSKNGPRGRIALAQAAAVERLFSTGRHKEALEQHLAQQAITQQESSSAKQSGERREDRTHTYDMKSGRKILLTQAYLDAAARQRKVEAVGNLKNASDIEGNQSRENRNRNNESSLPPVPSRPEWPGKSTGASVDRWIKRMLIARTGDEIDSSYSHPRHFSAYRIMEKLDMVISIEHCFNCAHHSLSLRHDPNEYSKNTDTVLRAVAQLAHGK